MNLYEVRFSLRTYNIVAANPIAAIDAALVYNNERKSNNVYSVADIMSIKHVCPVHRIVS